LLARAKLMSSNLGDAAEALADVLALDLQRRISSLNSAPVLLPAYRPLVWVRRAIESSRAIDQDERHRLADRCAACACLRSAQLPAPGRDDPR
jgi:hypothetical protein